MVLLLSRENEVTSEPLVQFSKDDPVSCAQYALDNDLIDKEGRSGAGRLLATITDQIYSQRKEDIVQDFILWLEETQQSKERANKTLEGLAVNYSGLQIEKFVSYNHIPPVKDRQGNEIIPQKIVVKSQMSSIEQKIISSLPAP